MIPAELNDAAFIVVQLEPAEHEDIITALEAGVNNYIVKPFTPAVLKEKIDSLIVTPTA